LALDLAFILGGLEPQNQACIAADAGGRPLGAALKLRHAGRGGSHKRGSEKENIQLYYKATAHLEDKRHLSRTYIKKKF
jgi:hypothetical protein